jgi:hypothetical protein
MGDYITLKGVSELTMYCLTFGSKSRVEKKDTENDQWVIW